MAGRRRRAHASTLMMSQPSHRERTEGQKRSAAAAMGGVSGASPYRLGPAGRGAGILLALSRGAATGRVEEARAVVVTPGPKRGREEEKESSSGIEDPESLHGGVSHQEGKLSGQHAASAQLSSSSVGAGGTSGPGGAGSGGSSVHLGSRDGITGSVSSRCADSDITDNAVDYVGGNRSAPPKKKSCMEVTPPGHSVGPRADTSASPFKSTGADSKPGKNWEEILHSLPTRHDMDCLFNLKLEAQSVKLEAMVMRELAPVQEAIAGLSNKVKELEADLIRTNHLVGDCSTKLESHHKLQYDLAMHLLELENRDRRANIRFRGIPETIPQEALKDQLLAICNFYLDRPPKDALELDRFHRVPAFKSRASDRPRDVVCRFHYYTDKDAILKGAWAKGPYTLNNCQVSLLQDLAAKTLRMRKILRPLLDLLKSKNFSYRWGFPLSLIIRKEGRRFSLRSPSQLPKLFEFLDSAPIAVPDWLQIVFEPSFLI